MENKLKVFTTFSGYDSQCLALNRLKEYAPGFDYELVGWSEIDKNAIKAHNALFPEAAELNYGDISKVDWKDTPDFDLFTYSSPCFPAGTLITVEGGAKNIEDVCEGDRVLTHEGRFRRVEKTMRRMFDGKLVEVRAGKRAATCTPNHPFLCAKEGEDGLTWTSAGKMEPGVHCPRRLASGTGTAEKPAEFYSSALTDVSEMPEDRTEVYNLEVEEDHSYVANGFAVHNCQDWSSAGLQKGGIEGSGTRSSLLWECRKTITIKRPKYCILENVLGLLSQKFLPYFEKWIGFLNSLGYRSFYRVCNARDYGVPQNRPRVFLVSVREDVDLKFSFPQRGVKKRPHLWEILEPDEAVSEKYVRKPWRLEHYLDLNKDALERLSVPENSNDEYDLIPCGIYCHSSDGFNSPPLLDVSRCLKAESIESGIIYKKNGVWHERLFTQRECFRLMGLRDGEYDKIASAVPLSPQSRMAGNSIVVDVIFNLFRKMFVDTEPDVNAQYVLF